MKAQFPYHPFGLKHKTYANIGLKMIDAINNETEKALVNVEQARTLAQDWMDDYNNYHPHASLGNCSPIEFKLKRSA